MLTQDLAFLNAHERNATGKHHAVQGGVLIRQTCGASVVSQSFGWSVVTSVSVSYHGGSDLNVLKTKKLDARTLV